ncbi:MAG TPA: hypothetical protein VE913_05355, partial [Longimicrobium sp.]|nr:hypothetical protein [Longimicrobium sp.]
MRNAFRKLPVLGLVVFAAACGGGDAAETETSATPANEAVSTDVPEAAAPPVATTDPSASAATAPATGTVHQVRMTTTQGGASGEFVPANITVKKGDVIRFTSEGNAVHNVSFPATENAGKGNLPAAGPFKNNGETYEL